MKVIVFRKSVHTYGFFNNLEVLRKSLKIPDMEISYNGCDLWQKHIHVVKYNNLIQGHIVSPSKDSLFTEGEFKRVNYEPIQ